MPRTVFLQIRLTNEEKDRLEQVARASYLDASTWARMVLLQAADRAEAEKTFTDHQGNGSS